MHAMSIGSSLRSFVLITTLALAGCAAASTGTPPGSPSVLPSIPIATPGPASAGPAATPSSACSSEPCGSPAPSAASCADPLLTSAGILDQLVDVRLDPGATSDRVTFELAASSISSPASPSVTAGATHGPFVADPSGLPLDVAGTRFIAVTFRGMTLVDESGAPVYTGATEPSAPGPGVRAVVRQSAYEGVTTWIIGYDPGGCPDAEIGAASVTIIVPHD
jgi:hypothetical protein